MSAIEEKRFQRIVNVLLLNASSIDNLGLMYGKMGIAIYFFHLASETKNPVYEEYAGELLEQVFKEIHLTSLVDFSSGLSGIGWGVEYLLQRRFVESGEDNILEELDTAIFQLDRKNPRLPRVYNDFYSYGLYYLCRAKNDVWNEEALYLIWNDLTSLLNETLPEGVILCPDYIISMLYFLCEIQKRPYCPSDINKILSTVPEFVSKHFSEEWNILEQHYLELVLINLGLFSHKRTEKKEDQLSSPQQQLKQYGKAALFEIIFGEVQPINRVLTDYRIEIPEVLEHEEVLEKMFWKPGNKNPDLQWSMAGCALAILQNGNIMNYQQILQVSHSSIYIFTRKSRAAEFGIGTYIRELSTGLKNKGLNIAVIHLDAERPEFTIEDHEGIANWYIPGTSNCRTSSIGHDEYSRLIVTLMRLYIKSQGNLVFHLNFMRDYQLALYLRQTFVCKILLTVHYMDWSFALQGNLLYLRKILAQSEDKVIDPLEISVLNLFNRDKKLMDFVDHIICLADYARNILCQIYMVDNDKITVVNNGLSDLNTFTPDVKLRMKVKYRINPEEKVILFAGRLNEIKGVSYLIKAFKDVLLHEPDCRLWIIGSGIYDPLFKEAHEIWHKICFTGQIDQKHLFELYTIADIGVVPSLFEPFGYVAVEMMMHGLPILVTATSGLDEIVEDEISGLKVNLISENKNNEVDISMMTQKLIYLLQYPEERKKLGRNGRNRYLERYTAFLMCEKTISCYIKMGKELRDNIKTNIEFSKDQ